MTTKPLFDLKLPDEAGTGWKVTIGIDYQPWLAAAAENHPQADPLAFVSIDPAGWAVGANGFALAAVPCEIQAGLLQDSPFEGALVPSSVLKVARKSAKKLKLNAYEFYVVGDHATVELSGGGMWGECGSETYPDWRGLLPQHLGPSVNVAIDLRMAAAVEEAIAAYGGFVWLSGTGPMAPFVLIGPEAQSFGLVMPMAIEHDVERATSVVQRALRRVAVPV